MQVLKRQIGIGMLALGMASAALAVPPWISGGHENGLGNRLMAPSDAAKDTEVMNTIRSLKTQLGVAKPAAVPALGAATGQRTHGKSHKSYPTSLPGMPSQEDSVIQTTDQEIKDKAFQNVLDSALPMTPGQILKLHGMYDATQRAAARTPGTPPKPVSRTLSVNLAPGAVPPVIRLSAGFVSTLVFMDASGAAWPIEVYDLGNPKDFNISWNHKDNMLMIQALTFSKVANLMVKLKGLSTPVMMTITTDQPVVDYRVDLRIPSMGPGAHVHPTGQALPSAANPLLLNILNGVPPSGSQALHSSQARCEAWLYQEKLYVRTPFKMLSPSWMAVMSSADGTHAYELQPTSFVLLSDDGKTYSVKLSGYDHHG